MGSRLYVGGVPYAATETQFTTFLFAGHGTVESARVIADKFTGQSRGFRRLGQASDEILGANTIGEWAILSCFMRGPSP